MRMRKALEPAIEDLNLTPYMDVMVNLIMFMLVSMTSFIDLNVINVSAPSATVTPGPAPATKRGYLLGIREDKGFVVSVEGKLEGDVAGVTTIPLEAAGGFDFDALRDRLGELKRLEPSQTQITIVPDKGIDYATVVRTMDAIRRDDGGRPLFPEVALGTTAGLPHTRP